ncbi:hypothetical protein P152DRAFT_394873 [Eremomyces bilateralis CBS 781.70]|uniref:Zn(2)-C6 fungal-type domain-containing protein n=1 Tax=Eremomyces bilateralis CBS 781.70 TaxID=1392243 RepID=A0A6G1G671_9PEZI|nr:uncharacterized protein P152DRAFT_394873 [Eremomyces bilateralis CBS 781.70]KAF1813451.1 hypothetical protein P152DRAFT_394873 [Eremomyces bilateralis CBS 781.70]
MAESTSLKTERGGSSRNDGRGTDSRETTRDESTGAGETGITNGNGAATKPNPKDPTRPRRKKARRACFACQRAHLTCGDERPCQRCVKRGIADQCHDGVRKKAKYLHDAPPEALLPGVGGNYHHHLRNGSQSAPNAPQSSLPMSQTPLAQSAPFFSPTQTSGFDMYQQTSSQSQMQPPMQSTPGGSTFSNQQTPISPPFQLGGHQQTPPLQNMATSMPQSGQSSVNPLNQFGGPLFDPSDPAIYNFDVSSFNFSSNYGAMEFGMLGQIATGAGDSDNDSSLNPPFPGATYGQQQPQALNSGSFSDASGQHYLFGQDALMQADWQSSHPRPSSVSGLLSTPHNTPTVGPVDLGGVATGGMPNAYAIGAGPGSLSSASPGSTAQEMGGFDNQPISPSLFSTQPPGAQQQHQNPQTSQQPVQQLPPPPPRVTKRQRDASVCYSVKEPYGYTASFHALVSTLRSRLGHGNLVRVARSLSAVRPSFISCQEHQSREDLVHAEKSFQRWLWEYEGYLNAHGTPTIILRRTGEVAACSKEFCILTGWNREVLLGREKNHNSNRWEVKDSRVGTGKAGLNTPRIPTQEQERERNMRNGTRSPELQKPVPISIAELLDDDSVVQFFDDFSRLAFSASNDWVMRRGRILKYREHPPDRAAAETGPMQDVDGRTGGMEGEAGMNRLGEKEGSVDTMFCWHVKSDLFGMPALLVMNVSLAPVPTFVYTLANDFQFLPVLSQ